MLFNEWYTQDKQNEVAQHSSTLIAEWFHRFNNFELLYDEATFWELFYVELLNCKLEIAKITELTKQLKTGDIPEFNNFTLGNKQTSNSTSNDKSTANQNGTDTQNYQGYNVEGTFSKNASTTETTSTQNNTNETTATSINQLDEIFKLANADLAILFNQLYKRFLPLFVTYY